MRLGALVSIGILPVVMVGCKNPAVPSVSLDKTFIVAPKSAVIVGPDRLRLEFLRVTGDSRCPVDVVCIQGGDAVVHVRVEDWRGS